MKPKELKGYKRQQESLDSSCRNGAASLISKIWKAGLMHSATCMVLYTLRTNRASSLSTREKFVVSRNENTETID